jgi:hypothetical protein
MLFTSNKILHLYNSEYNHHFDFHLFHIFHLNLFLINLLVTKIHPNNN